MPQAQAIQYRTLDSVLSAFDREEIPSYGIFQGRYLISAGVFDTVESAKEALADTLKSLQDEGSTAIYTLKTYCDVDKRSQITDKAPANSSCNFRLNDPYSVKKAVNGEGSITLTDRVKSMEEKIGSLVDALEYDGEEDEPAEPMIIGLLSNEKFIAGVSAILGQLKNVFMPQIQGIGSAGNLQGDFDPMPILMQADPDLLNDLRRLARIAQTDPQKFQGLLAMLRSN